MTGPPPRRRPRSNPQSVIAERSDTTRPDTTCRHPSGGCRRRGSCPFPTRAAPANRAQMRTGPTPTWRRCPDGSSNLGVDARRAGSQAQDGNAVGPGVARGEDRGIHARHRPPERRSRVAGRSPARAAGTVLRRQDRSANPDVPPASVHPPDLAPRNRLRMFGDARMMTVARSPAPSRRQQRDRPQDLALQKPGLGGHPSPRRHTPRARRGPCWTPIQGTAPMPTVKIGTQPPGF